MRLGVGLPTFASDETRAPASRLRHYAKSVESHGFAGGWFLEHLRTPPTYATSWHDSLTSLSHVGGVTSNLPLGTSILISPMREPVLVAKRAATINHLTEGRLTLGVGVGYVEGEYDAVNVPFDERGPRFREGLKLIRRLFTEDEVTFDGDFYSVEDFRLEPSLARPPRIIVGGSSVERDGEFVVPRVVKERLRYADGWISAPRPPERVRTTWDQLSSFLLDIDERPDDYERYAITWTHLVPGADSERAVTEQRRAFRKLVGTDRPLEHADENYLTGTIDEMIDQLHEYEDIGIDQFILCHPPATPSEYDRQLDLWAEHLLPEFR